MTMAKKKLRAKTYQVWFAQVNAVRVEVRVKNPADVEDAALRKWRKEWGHPRIKQVEEGEHGEVRQCGPPLPCTYIPRGPHDCL